MKQDYRIYRINIVRVAFLLLLFFCKGNAYADASDDFKLGTIPTLYINTENVSAIMSKEEYLNASYWIVDSSGGSNLGSEASPLELSIKGHGNATWRAYDKKPYRIKLSQKQPLLGMKKNKHFVLLALMDDNGRAFLKYPVAFELSKRIGLGWNPTTDLLNWC